MQKDTGAATVTCEDWGEDMGEYGDDYSWWTWPQEDFDKPGDDHVATLDK